MGSCSRGHVQEGGTKQKSGEAIFPGDLERARQELDIRRRQLGQCGFQDLLRGAHSRKGFKFKCPARFPSIT